MNAKPAPYAVPATPDLELVARFTPSLSRLSWFAAVGQDLTDGETKEARDYLSAIGLGRCALHAVPGWRGAEAVTRDPNWNHAWWDAEEKLRLALLDSLRAAWGEHVTMSALTRVTDEATRVTLGAASVAASRDGIADPALTRVAAGAATQAAYQAALARLAGAGEDHPFAAKFRLFAAGRWPLGLIGNSFYLF
jgi:hypothetical protein